MNVSTGKNPLLSHPPLLDIHAIKQIRPSAYDPHSFLSKIRAILLKIFNLFSSRTSPADITFKALADSGKSSKKQMLEIFRRCLGKEKNHASLISQYENLLQEARDLNLYTNDDQRIKEKIKFEESFKQKINTLKDGQSLLLPLSGQENVNTFYLLQKNNKGYSLKIIGCDEWMPQLSGVPSKKMGGKEKVLSQIAFQEIPDNFFTDERILSLFCTPLLEKCFNALELKKNLGEIPAKCRVDLTDKDRLWVTRSAGSRKAIGLLMQELNSSETYSHEAKVARKRLEFQTRLYTLFDFYKQSSQFFPNDKNSISALRQISREIAKEASLLGTKGYLSKKDLEEIHKELTLIDAATKKAEESALAPLTQLGSLKTPQLKLSFGGLIQSPIEVKSVKKSFEVRSPEAIKGQFPVACTSLLSEETKLALKSNKAEPILKEINTAKELAKKWAWQGYQELASELVMELTGNIQWKDFTHSAKEQSWLFSLTPDQVLDLQNTIFELSKVLVDGNTLAIPVPNRAVVMFQLTQLCQMLHAEMLYEDKKSKNSGSQNRLISHAWIDDVFNVNLFHDSDSKLPHDLQRPFYQANGENIHLVESLTEQKVSVKFAFSVSKEQDKKSTENAKQQNELFCRFFGIPEVTSQFQNNAFTKKAFQPQQMQRWTKSFKNPLFIAALRQMHLHGFLIGVGFKYFAEGKLNGGISFDDPENPTVSWNKSDAEVKEMQKDLDRYESLKLPEAISDDPQRVFDMQYQELKNRMKEYGAEGKFDLKPIANEFKKEELTGLLNLLRKDSPQVEAIGFIKAFPHLLSNSDVRNFLEIVLFDVGGSSIAKTLESNTEFKKSLPTILEDLIVEFHKLHKKDPAYCDHLLFTLSLVRKFRGIYLAVEKLEKPFKSPWIVDEKLPIDQFDKILAGNYLDTILKDPSLKHRYGFRAQFEQLMNDMDRPKDLFHIAKSYHALKALPRESHDVDPNEMDQLQRRYAACMYFLKDASPQNLVPLLDTLCEQDGLKLDSSAWRGSCPVFTNDQYEINLMKSTIIDHSSGGTVKIIPQEILTHPTYSAAFQSIDRTTMLVRSVQKGDTTIYLISDKNGDYGRVEIEKGSCRFYRQLHENEKASQVITIADETFPLHSFPIYFSSDKQHEGFILDASGKSTVYKVQFQRQGNQYSVVSVIECTHGKDSGPYQVQSLEEVSEPAFSPLKQFENGKGILAFSKNGKLEKIKFVRYGLSFTYKKGNLYSDDDSLRGYRIDMQGSKTGISNALLLRHKDSAMPDKMILPDVSVIASRTEIKQKQLSTFQLIWLYFNTWKTGKAPRPEQLEEVHCTQGPQYSGSHSLKSRLFNIRPYTGELTVADQKNKVEGNLSLVSHALLNREYRLALLASRKLKLENKDLTHEHVSLLLDFLKVRKEDAGHTSSIKIQIALELKKAIGKKLQFNLISKKLNTRIEDHIRIYLQHGKKIDHQLQLNKAQFLQVAKIVKKSNPSFYDNHLRIFLLEPGKKAPQLSDTDGTPLWKGYADIDFKEAGRKAQLSGMPGAEDIPLEELEKKLAGLKPKSEAPITLEKQGQPLLYQDEELMSYFDASPYVLPDVVLPKVDEQAPSCEKKAVEKLRKEMAEYRRQAEGKFQYAFKANQQKVLQKKISEQAQSFKAQAETHRNKIDFLLKGGDDAVLSLAIAGGQRQVAGMQEISLAFMQRDLQSLVTKNLLPSNLEIKEFEILLHDYFDAESKYLLLQTALKVKNDPNALYQLLTTKRFYSPKAHPELLVYECFTRQLFRQLGFERNQIHLLSEMLAKPTGVFQAITGAGKTTVLSVLRGLLQANGTNLVTFRLLPTLFEQSKSILQQKLGEAFNRKIYSLKFTLKMSPVIREKQKDGSVVESSLFKKMYHDLLMTVEEKGCVLTDYKSIPLLQEKWVKFNREFVARRREGLVIPDIEKEHWLYLKKILLLVQSKEQSLMDEFDVPNRSCNRLQIPLGKPVDVAPFLCETTLNLYEELRNIPELKLSLDQQKDVGDARKMAIRKVAQKFAGKNEKLLPYFLGETEIDLSGYSLVEQDRLTLLKDQFSIFLPLTLSKASGLHYQRHSDGTHTVPCNEGEAQENSRFGHPLEEINYTIQDYIQNGVSVVELQAWVKDLMNESMRSQIPHKQFAAIFPNRNFPKSMPSEQQLIELQHELNGNWDHVKYFLEMKLKELTVSGEVISMTPHDSAAMANTVSGLSATSGCPEELPQQLNADTTAINGILGEMAYRLIERTGVREKPLEFDPENPFEVLSKGEFGALIDGAGAYRAHAPEVVAAKLQEKSQADLKQVGYHAGKVDFVGDIECKLPQKGFYFTKAKSRGADISLDPKAKAVLTVDGQKNLEDLMQNDGRMRLKGQRIQIARSKLNPEITCTEDLLVKCARTGGQNDSTGLFRSKMQQISHLVRQQAYEQLIGLNDFNETLSRFEELESLFIHKPLHDYNRPGTYAAQNRRIRKREHDPKDVLQAEKEKWIKIAGALDLKVDALSTLTWSSEILEKMPLNVPGVDDTFSTGLEVEEEVEIEHEIENEMDVEAEAEIEEELNLDQCGDVPFYPAWKKIKPKEYSAAQWFHQAFDPRLTFTENFLPVERNDHLFKRSPFDRAMPSIKTIHVIKDCKTDAVTKIIFGDVLDDVLHRPYKENYGKNAPKSLTNDPWSYSYDVRTRDKIADGIPMASDLKNNDFLQLIAQVKLINGEFEGYSNDEWNALIGWLKGVKNVREFRQFFEKVVLRSKPLKAAGFKHSRLFKELELMEMQQVKVS